MSLEPENYPFVDVGLSRRLERTEAHANAAFVEARARLAPDHGAEWIDVSGAYAMFDGVGSPLTQTFGLGMFAPVTAPDMERLERFFTDRGAEVHHEVSPLADPSALALLTGRGYEPFELTSVMFQAVGYAGPEGPALRTAEGPGLRTPAETAGARPLVRVRRIDADDAAVWAETSARGWGETPELRAFMAAIGQVSVQAKGNWCFLAELDGEPIAAGSLHVFDGVALLGGASTVPEARRQGAQLALLDARLRFAVVHGCDLAMMCASPGSASQRNAERHGFRIAYTRIKWRLRERRA